MLGAALIAAALKAITPIGYMIGHNEATGRIAIMICTGIADKTAYSDPLTDKGMEDDGAPEPSMNEAGQCPFASFNLLFAPVNTPAELGVRVAFIQAPLWRAQSVFHDNLSAVSPPPSRGPPLSV